MTLLMVVIGGMHRWFNKSPIKEFVRNAMAIMAVMNIPVVISNMSTDMARDSMNIKIPLKYLNALSGRRTLKNRMTRSTLSTRKGRELNKL